MQLSRFTQFHEDAAVIAWWQSRAGGALSWFTPFRRRAILAASAVWIGIKEPLNSLAKVDDLPVPSDGFGKALVILALFGILWLCYRAAVRFSSLPGVVRRHPLLTLHLLYWGFLALLWFVMPPTGPWRMVMNGVAIVLPYLIWRCSYMLLAGQHGRMAGTRFHDHLLYLWPAYGGSNTPYGKGLIYLSRCEAKTEEELARSQLAGIKLLILSGLWGITLNIMEGVLYGPGNALTGTLGGYTVGIPELSQLTSGSVQAPLWASWTSVYCELVWQVLHHAIRGHQIIAILRLFGFNVFRNTYKPLLAESVVEFWNRYYYYFKELLANFFFLPTFAQLGKRLRSWPQLRLFLAVFAAAFIGNMYYHLIQHDEALALGNVYDRLYALRSRMFYCLLLAIGIYLSMVREQRRGGKPPAAGAARRVLRIFGVWTFFGLIFIWNVKGGGPFFARVDFFLGLFGLA